jgi:hypothetical protein
MTRGSRILVVGITVIALLAVAITATVGWRPFFGPRRRPLTSRTFERTPERMARGRYLVNGVTGCLGCHSEVDLKSPGALPLSGTEGAGRVWKDEGMPWLVASNITPDPETPRAARSLPPILGSVNE